MRTAFINQLIKEARRDKSIYLIVGDLGYGVVEEFQKEFPDRFLNAGIAEQNMMGVAAGLAMTGYKVYIYSIGNFPTLRCLEQIRNDVCYHDLDVKIVAVGAGFTYGSLGATHHATEDIAIMRVLPNMTVLSPSDPGETMMLTSYTASQHGPMYLRLGKAGEQVIETQLHNEALANYEFGDLLPVINNGSTECIIATGSITSALLDDVRTSNLRCDIYSCAVIKPMNSRNLAEIVKRYEAITVVEEHQRSGGLGAAILEVINDLFADGSIARYPKVVVRGINDTFVSTVGSQKTLRKRMNLSI